MNDRGFGRRIAMFALFIPLLAALSWGIGVPPVAAGTDAEDVAAAKAALVEEDFSFADGDDKDNVTQDFTLPTTGLNDTTIDWEVVNTTDVEDFIVLVYEFVFFLARPTSADGDQIVQLRATINKGAESDTKDLQVVLKATTKDEEDAANVADAKTALSANSFTYAPGDDKDRVTTDFIVPLVGANDTTITYTIQSDPLGNVSLAGDTVTVVRPSGLQGSQTVTLLATISKGSQTDTKELSVVIKSFPAGRPEAGDIVTFAGADWLCVHAARADGYKLLRLEHSGSTMMFTNYSQLERITNGEYTLVKGTDWNWSGWGIEYEVTISNSYLAAQPTGVISLSFGFSGGFTNTLAITSTSTLSPSNAITLPRAAFIMLEEHREDLVTTIITYGHSLTSITNGADTLVRSSDYTLSGNKLTIAAAYLARQTGDSLVLTLNFDGGNSVDFEIELSATSLPDGTLNPSVANFVQDQPSALTIKVTEDYYYNPNTNDYSVSDLREYLNGDFYDNFTPLQQDMIPTMRWNYGVDADEASRTVTDKIGLLTKSEMVDICARTWYVADSGNLWWSMTSYSLFSAGVWYVGEFPGDSAVDWMMASNYAHVRPVLYLRYTTAFHYIDGKYVVVEQEPFLLRYPLMPQRCTLQ